MKNNEFYMDRINEILSTVSGFYTYDDNMARKYIELLHEAIDVISKIEAEPTSMLENAKSAAVTELSNELANRMTEKSFFKSPLERRRSEFRISKALVMVAIDNLIANM